MTYVVMADMAYVITALYSTVMAYVGTYVGTALYGYGSI